MQATTAPSAAFSPDFNIGGSPPLGGTNIPAWHGIPALRRLSPGPRPDTAQSDCSPAPTESAGSCAQMSRTAFAAVASSEHGRGLRGRGDDGWRGDEPVVGEGRGALDLSRFASTPNPLFEELSSEASQEGGAEMMLRADGGRSATAVDCDGQVRHLSVLHGSAMRSLMPGATLLSAYCFRRDV